MKLKFPSFRNSTRSYQTINQAYRSMLSARNPITSLDKNSVDYVRFLNRQTYNRSWFQNFCRTIKIMFGK